MVNVTAVRHVRDHVLWLQFNDGGEGGVDLARELQGEVFVPLRECPTSRRCASIQRFAPLPGPMAPTSHQSSFGSFCAPAWPHNVRSPSTPG